MAGVGEIERAYLWRLRDTAAKSHVANDDVRAIRHGDFCVRYSNSGARRALPRNGQVTAQIYIRSQMDDAGYSKQNHCIGALRRFAK